MILQDPMTSLNPVLRVGFQVEEALAAHQRFTRPQARERVAPLLTRVRIPAAEQRVRDYPHQFSGGMRQRAMIAMGVSNEPSLLIADEPTTALDVTVQASIIELVRDLSGELGASVILITHNMALIASLCQRVIVMYAGRIVEEGPTRAIFKNPQHPYTWSLLRSIPRVDEKTKEKLISIRGLPPDLSKPPPGCKFHPRCRFRVDRCFTEEPSLEEVEPGHLARCWVLMRNVEAPEAAQGTLSPRSQSIARSRNRWSGSSTSSSTFRSEGDCSGIRSSMRMTVSASPARPARRWGWSESRRVASPLQAC